jgi:hypothetical protein
LFPKRLALRQDIEHHLSKFPLHQQDIISPTPPQLADIRDTTTHKGMMKGVRLYHMGPHWHDIT